MPIRILKKVSKVLKKEFCYYLPHPTSATISLTARCNLKCRACGVWRQQHKLTEELDTRSIFRVLGELKTMSVKKIYLIEGEPLLRSDIVEIVREVTRLGMDSEITTNGTLLNGELSRSLVESGLGCLLVSIDAPNNAHDNMRGVPGVFDRVIQGIKSLVEAKESLSRKAPVILINCLITSETVAYLDNWLDFAAGLRVNGINFLYPSFVPEKVDNAAMIAGRRVSSGRFVDFDRKLILRKENVHLLLNKLRKIRADGSRKGLSIWLSPNMFLVSPEGFENGMVPLKRCYLIRDSLIINPYGEVIPCALLDKYSYGSVNREPLEKIWMNTNHRLLLRYIRKGFDLCKYCGCHFDHNVTIDQQLRLRANN